MFDRRHGTASEPPEPPGDEWFSFAEITERLAQLVWVEEQLGSLYSLWAVTEAHPGAAILLSAAGSHHVWHAKLLRDCLATSAQLSAEATPGPPTPGWVDGIELLAAIGEPGQTATRLRAIVRYVDPWLVRETSTLLELARPVADAHLIRWLGFIDIDHQADGAGCAKLLDAVQANTVSLQDRTRLAALDLTSRQPAPVRPG